MARLRQAWLDAGPPDRWLTPLLPDRCGLEWSVLRRRLVAWAEALPTGYAYDPATLYAALAATFGPLADAQTHGFRSVDRAPWQPRRAAAVWEAALRGPLTWLGWVAWGVGARDRGSEGEERVARSGGSAATVVGVGERWLAVGEHGAGVAGRAGRSIRLKPLHQAALQPHDATVIPGDRWSSGGVEVSSAPGGTVRADQPDAAGGCLHSGQHCRETWPPAPCGVSPASLDSAGGVDRSGNPAPDSGPRAVSGAHPGETGLGTPAESGAVAQRPDPRAVVIRPHSPLPDPHSPIPWNYGAPGTLIIPHTQVTAAVVRLLPFSTWSGADANGTIYRITATRLRQALGQGWSPEQLWALLEQHAGPPPLGWCAGLDVATPVVRIAPHVLVTAEVPVVLQRAARARSVRRHLGTRLAPGITSIPPEAVRPLARALTRQGVIPLLEPPPPPPPVPTGLAPGDCAALLVACAFYRTHAPPTAPLLPDDGLTQRLDAALPPPLRQATARVLADPAAGGLFRRPCRGLRLLRRRATPHQL